MNLARYAVAQNAVNARFALAGGARAQVGFSRLRNVGRRRLLRGFPVSSLRQLLARHSSLLVVDSCAPRTEAALWLADAGDAPVTSAAIEGEASAALPVAVARVLAHPAADGKTLRDIDAVAFCDGPGSVLGVRLAAATLRAWRAVRPELALYSYHSLPLLALAHPGLTIVADARRDGWHAARGSRPHEIVRVPSAELASLGPLGTPDNFRRWSALPAGVEPRSLTWSAVSLIAAAPEARFFEDSPEPEAFLHEPPSYAAWTPRIHQAPTAVGPSPQTPAR